MAYNFRKQAMIKKLQRAKEAIASKEKLAAIYESTVFSVKTLGWINCDHFYDDPTAGKAEIMVSNSSPSDLYFIDCSLVIPDLNIRLNGYPDGKGAYSLTQKDGRYTKLPIGRSAVIVGVSTQHDSIFFASKKINIKDGLHISLPMRPINRQALKDSLKAILAKPTG